jgi:hypothetical protein
MEVVRIRVNRFNRDIHHNRYQIPSAFDRHAPQRAAEPDMLDDGDRRGLRKWFQVLEKRQMAKPSSVVRNPRVGRRANRRWHPWGALALALATQAGCGREFFRHWADQDVSESVFEKSRDPRWRLDLFTVEPPPLSRFADPYDPDRLPAPPDDHAAEALAPVPQWPHHRLMLASEGTGYLDLLNQGNLRYSPPPKAKAEGPDLLDDNQVPRPDPRYNPPFQKPTEPLDDPLESAPPAELPARPMPGQPDPRTNSGPKTETLTPNTIPTQNGVPAIPTPNPPGPGQNPQAQSVRQEPGVPRTAIQQKSNKTPSAVAARSGAAGRGAAPLAARENPARDGAVVRTRAQDPAPVPPINLPPIERQEVPADLVPFDPERQNPDRSNQGIERLDIPLPTDDPQARFEEIQRRKSSFASILVPGAATFNESEAAGLPYDARPYIVTPAQALNLALINNRAYQFQLENIYIAALNVTFQRFQFEPQGVAGFSPTTAPAGASIFPNNINQWQYNTAESPQGQISRLNFGTVAGFGKLFMFGGRIFTGFANQTVFNFIGTNPGQPSVQSTIPLTIAQPLLKGGGRAVTLENLTLAERNLLYEIRAFARFRQLFIPYILTAQQGLGAVGGVQATGQTDTGIGYLSVLQQVLTVENNRRNVAAFEQILTVYREYAKNSGSSGISQLQIDQVEQNLQNARQQLVTAEVQYRNSLDQFKIQLGLPPDVPIILDRTATNKFREVFKELDLWILKEGHDPAQLPGIINGLPSLESIELEGRPLFTYVPDEKGQPVLELAYGEASRIEDLNLAAERIALESRLDLMNAKAQLYDSWRQFAVLANALKAVFTVGVTNQVFTPPSTSNPFGFDAQSKSIAMTVNSELPLVRVNERNQYAQQRLLYRRQRASLMQQEDQIKFQVRQEIRALVQQALIYEYAKRNLFYTMRSRDQSIQEIVAPPASSGGASTANTSQTINLIQFTQNVNNQQNSLVSAWVTYQTQRLLLYRDLGIMPYDEWEAYDELFPANTAGAGGVPSNDGGVAPGGAPNRTP